ncbi:hypothetical protein [Prosthecobacter sp.]|uniref:hypothetical protein n=1 Tax=Prosthecobacter sp. TaxID=1965333 RepID=UPI003783FC6D
MSLKISQITCIGWTLLPRLQNRVPCPFTLEELEDAIANRTTMDLLLKLDDENQLILTSVNLGKDAINKAMSDAGYALSGRWSHKTAIEDDVTCCVMAMVLEAIQQNFRQFSPME